MNLKLLILSPILRSAYSSIIITFVDFHFNHQNHRFFHLDPCRRRTDIYSHSPCIKFHLECSLPFSLTFPFLLALCKTNFSFYLVIHTFQRFLCSTSSHTRLLFLTLPSAYVFFFFIYLIKFYTNSTSSSTQSAVDSPSERKLILTSFPHFSDLFSNFIYL